MKKTLKSLALSLALALSITPAFGADQWQKLEPQGSRSPSTIDDYVGENNESLDRLLTDYRVDCTVIPDTAAQIKVLAGQLAISNSGGSVVRWRENTSTTTVTWSDIDTGSEASSTQYYVYAVADTDATTFTVTISTNATAPSGATYYRKIGYFYNDGSSDIISVGNVKGGDVENCVSAEGTSDITTTSTSYVDMTDMTVYFVSSGRPVEITYSGFTRGDGDTDYVTIGLNVDGSVVKAARSVPHHAYGNGGMNTTVYRGTLSSGTHTIKVQWFHPDGSHSCYQTGSSYKRHLIVKEL